MCPSMGDVGSQPSTPLAGRPSPTCRLTGPHMAKGLGAQHISTLEAGYTRGTEEPPRCPDWGQHRVGKTTEDREGPPRG